MGTPIEAEQPARARHVDQAPSWASIGIAAALWLTSAVLFLSSL